MKVLFVTRGFPSDKDPMSGNYEAVQAKAIAAKGHEVSVMSVYEKPMWYIGEWHKVTHRKIDNINVYEGIYPSISIRFVRRINKYLRKISYRHVFNENVKDQGMPDIIHGHIISTSSFAIFLKDEYHIPFVITEHWSKTFGTVFPIWIKRMSMSYRHADKVICVSQVLADSLKKNFNIESIVINNMVNDLFFRSSKKIRNDNQFRFVACGAFREDRFKGFDILVDAFASSNFPENVTLDIIGDGEEKKNIERQVNEYGINNQIHLLGVKTPEDVSEILCNSDCFVLSSRIETFAIVLIEAMAKGLPVIATRCGGPETFLCQEHGLLVEKENVKALSDAMIYMVAHYKDYDSTQIRQFCYDNFSQDIIANQIIDVYKQVLAEKK